MNVKKKINTSLFIFFILIVLTIVFIVFPLLIDIKKGSNDLISEKNNLSVLDEQIASLEKFKILYKNLEEILKKIDKLFINSEVPVDFIGFLEKTARSSLVNIEIIPLSSGKIDKDPWPSINFQITANGSFSNFLSFLEKIESSPYLIEIQNLTVVQNSSEKKTAGNIQAIFSFKVFAK